MDTFMDTFVIWAGSLGALSAVSLLMGALIEVKTGFKRDQRH